MTCERRKVTRIITEEPWPAKSMQTPFIASSHGRVFTFLEQRIPAVSLPPSFVKGGGGGGGQLYLLEKEQDTVQHEEPQI